jgi:hypothetical protein
LFIFPSNAFAATKVATPSAITPTAKIPTTTVTPSENLEDKIKNLVKENLSATELNLKEAINLKSLIGHVGTIKSISTGSITVETDGNLFQITISDKTKISKLGIVSKLSSLAISDKVIVIGTLIKEDIIQAKVIKVIAEETDVVESDAIVAPVTSIDLKKKTITLTVKNAQVPYTLSKKTTIKIADIKVGQILFVITKKYQGSNSLSRAKIL